MTREEYKDRYKARLIERGITGDVFIDEVADVGANCALEFNGYETPEDDADDELSCWGDD